MGKNKAWEILYMYMYKVCSVQLVAWQAALDLRWCDKTNSIGRVNEQCIRINASNEGGKRTSHIADETADLAHDA